MGTDSIFNFIKIDDRIATGGQPTKEQLEAALAEGYKAVVNLAPNNAENFALPDEEVVVNSLGMKYHHIPVEWSRPKAEQFVAFIEVIEGLKGEKVLVHCAANFRATAFFALYGQKNEGWSTKQADELIARIWESRADYRMDETWRLFIDDMRKLIV